MAKSILIKAMINNLGPYLLCYRDLRLTQPWIHLALSLKRMITSLWNGISINSLGFLSNLEPWISEKSLTKRYTKTSKYKFLPRKLMKPPSAPTTSQKPSSTTSNTVLLQIFKDSTLLSSSTQLTVTLSTFAHQS